MENDPVPGTNLSDKRFHVVDYIRELRRRQQQYLPVRDHLFIVLRPEPADARVRLVLDAELESDLRRVREYLLLGVHEIRPLLLVVLRERFVRLANHDVVVELVRLVLLREPVQFRLQRSHQRVGDFRRNVYEALVDEQADAFVRVVDDLVHAVLGLAIGELFRNVF